MNDSSTSFDGLSDNSGIIDGSLDPFFAVTLDALVLFRCGPPNRVRQIQHDNPGNTKLLTFLVQDFHNVRAKAA